jgi:fused signal recognition particle receptor
MFGFLRRKKPVETPPAPAESVVQAGGVATDGAPDVSPDVAPDTAPDTAPLISAAAPAEAPREDTRRGGGFAAAIAGAFSGFRRSEATSPPDAAAPEVTQPEPQAERPLEPTFESMPDQVLIEPKPVVATVVDTVVDTTVAAAETAETEADEAAPSDVATAQAPTDRRPWMARLKQGLSRTRGNLAGLFIGVKVDEALFEELETALLVSDAGVEATAALLASLRDRVRRQRIEDAAQVKEALRDLLADLLRPLEQPIDIDRATPLVMMITGVNGAGKTTSIGKLAKHLRQEGKTVLLAAGDTFRAAAREQLAQWGSRNEVEVIAQQGADPAAVAFDAVSAGRARGTGVVLVDTAGRLPTQAHLMQELGKIRRVTAKAMQGAPHEVLLVLDGNTGQNMLAQVKAFDDAAQLTGLIVTKLDGTAKGGALVALAHTRREQAIPVYFIGVGERIDDLQAFSADEFAAALVD